MFTEQMATTLPLPAMPVEQQETNDISPTAQSEALMELRREERRLDRGIELGSPIALLPVELDVAVPVREFRVRDLLALDRGQVIETQWSNGEDVPLAAGQVQLAWSEFEVVDAQLGVRVTRLA